MEFEWDENKRHANIRKHGIDFIDAAKLFDGVTLTVPDDRFDYAEKRFVTFGLLQGVVIAIVHTEDKKAIRIISARKATKYEEQTYFKDIAD
jgi:uncharacterized DUF497 family protein